ncbi:uncharacterized protein LOC143274910 isoform X1 [Babylonia areolata]|uniref:uncharacterized protein LOC143274910 isoform X1 n=1 Tax=Babylonia areolata TaxID=304850 RepID=UPI003FD0DA6A
MPRMKQTNEVMKLTNHVAILVIVLASLARPLEGRVCTRVRSEQGVKVVSYPGECHQSFEANCGWFSFQKCVFNETVPCLKTRNITGTIYRIVEDCCPGYHKNRDGRCVVPSELDLNNKTWIAPTDNKTQTSTDKTQILGGKTQTSTDKTQTSADNKTQISGDKTQTLANNKTQTSTDNKTLTSAEGNSEQFPPPDLRQFGDLVTTAAGFNLTGQEDWDPDSGQVSDGGDEDDDDTFFLGISHGAYAGIICGILFIACVALLTAVHYRKRKLQEQKKNAMAADQEAAQRQQMIPLEKMDAAAPVAT